MLRRTSLLVVAFLLIAVGSLQAQDALQPITFFMTFIPNIQFAPVYVAIEKGYFADAGIEVTIEHGDEPDGVNLIAAGERQFGMISGEQVIAARANDRPVVFVYEWFQKYPVGVAAPTGGSIVTAADLAGHKVGIPGPFGASYSGLIALLAANGLAESDIQLESIGFNAPQVFCVGGVEATVVYVNNEPIQIDHLAEQGECGDITGTTVFNVADYADMVSNGIVTNEETIASDPELVQSFVTAFHQGVVDTINNPAEAYLISREYVESLTASDAFSESLISEVEAKNQALADGSLPDQDAVAASRAAFLSRLSGQFSADELLQMEVLLATIELWEADRLGYSDADSWQITEDTLIQMGQLSEGIDLASAFTNDFVPQG